MPYTFVVVVCYLWICVCFILQDQKRTEKVTKRINTIQEVKESVGLFIQLLQDYDGATSNQSNAELLQVNWTMDTFKQSFRVISISAMNQILSSHYGVCCWQDLYQRCEKMRPTLFRLASDTEDNDEALGEQH